MQWACWNWKGLSISKDGSSPIYSPTPIRYETYYDSFNDVIVYVSDLYLEPFRVYRNVTLGFIKGLQITFHFHNR